MQSTSLAVRYRPKVLDDLVGQSHIESMIRGMFKTKRIPPAILLHGPTGLGKTTVARMLAAMVNCRDFDTKTLTPCGECPSCRMGDASPDIREMNMADNTGIDNVRQLIKESKNSPTIGKFRIFILDEFHRASTQAQEALLKPVEEPPAGTLWIFASMSPERISPAIAKRCIRMEVKAIEPEAMAKRLLRIAKKEGVDFKSIKDYESILKAICNYSGGGMREAIQLLDGVLLAFASNKNLDAKTVLTQFLGTADADLERAAVATLIATYSRNLKGFVEEIRKVSDVRGVMYKVRYTLEYFLDNIAGTAKYQTYAAKLFATNAKKHDVRVDLKVTIALQALLMEIETKMNSLNVDDKTIFTAMVGNFIATLPKPKD